MNQKHLLKFIKKKLRTQGHEVVLFRDEKLLTLRQVFDSLKLTEDSISVSRLHFSFFAVRLVSDVVVSLHVGGYARCSCRPRNISSL